MPQNGVHTLPGQLTFVHLSSQDAGKELYFGQWIMFGCVESFAKVTHNDDGRYQENRNELNESGNWFVGRGNAGIGGFGRQSVTVPLNKFIPIVCDACGDLGGESRQLWQLWYDVMQW